jgi:hypothetical protein
MAHEGAHLIWVVVAVAVLDLMVLFRLLAKLAAKVVVEEAAVPISLMLISP